MQSRFRLLNKSIINIFNPNTFIYNKKYCALNIRYLESDIIMFRSISTFRHQYASTIRNCQQNEIFESKFIISSRHNPAIDGTSWNRCNESVKGQSKIQSSRFVHEANEKYKVAEFQIMHDVS